MKVGELKDAEKYDLAFWLGVRPRALPDFMKRAEMEADKQVWEFSDDLVAKAGHLLDPTRAGGGGRH